MSLGANTGPRGPARPSRLLHLGLSRGRAELSTVPLQTYHLLPAKAALGCRLTPGLPGCSGWHLGFGDTVPSMPVSGA